MEHSKTVGELILELAEVIREYGNQKNNYHGSVNEANKKQVKKTRATRSNRKSIDSDLVSKTTQQNGKKPTTHQ